MAATKKSNLKLSLEVVELVSQGVDTAPALMKVLDYAGNRGQFHKILDTLMASGWIVKADDRYSIGLTAKTVWVREFHRLEAAAERLKNEADALFDVQKPKKLEENNGEKEQ